MYLFLALANVFAAIVAALVAEKKGYSAGGWLLLGLVFGVFALLAIAVMPAGKKRVRIAFSDCDQGNYRQCPSCKELVLREAERCKHCQIDLEPLAPFQSPPRLEQRISTRKTGSPLPFSPSSSGSSLRSGCGFATRWRRSHAFAESGS